MMKLMKRGFQIRPWRLEDNAPVDWTLVGVMLMLSCLGVVMVASASVAIAERRFGMELRYVLQQLVFLLGSLLIAVWVIQKTTLSWWKENRGLLLLIAMVLVMMTLVLGREINGAKRWLSLGFFNLQPSEFLKLIVIVFMAAYIEKNFQQQQDAQGNRDWKLEKKRQMQAIKLLMLPLIPIFLLLLLQPDFGSLMVVLLLVFAMLLIAGAPLRLLLSVVPLGLALVVVIIIEPYRLARVVSFLDPWKDAQNTGYQLTHSLMALGRGDWFGVGLGNSVEKLFYLPDAHTDFLFAIYGEEFGFIGVVALVLLYLVMIWRIFRIGRVAAEREQTFAALICYGVGAWVAVQALINMGANLGLLPTKGLTLPLVSYGGSSLLMSMLALGLVLRIDWENRHAHLVVVLPPAAPVSSDLVDTEGLGTKTHATEKSA
ncbi:MAG TPA: putative lipid II flippase FtsW [Thiotrichales bacterium]|nr:putative lipid II flippase FtsW [Gammaproteobacteria bacterium]HQT02268.1 putative lipid II flippase FtsW [Thiotrichales bacterium]HQT03442.1 putative lipid II flippase FtsW [Thiotrichales bacterium]